MQMASEGHTMSMPHKIQEGVAKMLTRIKRVV